MLQNGPILLKKHFENRLHISLKPQLISLFWTSKVELNSLMAKLHKATWSKMSLIQPVQFKIWNAVLFQMPNFWKPYLKHYFQRHVCVSIRTSVRTSVRTYERPCVRRLAPIPAGESQDVTNKSCSICLMGDKKALRPARRA